ncbi:MAG: hypothetical protein GY856_29955 [bacterium]|nr:hypothetical protein [bacterium]
MSTLTVALSDDVLATLGAEARRHYRSLEEEARAVLEESLVRRRFRPPGGNEKGRLDTWHPVRRAAPRTPPGPLGKGEEGCAAVEELPVPESYQRDVRRAIDVLRRFGCREIHLFGSLITGEIHEESDIDLAVRGCPKRKFFHILAKLRRALEHSVDLVDLDCDDPFVHHLENNGKLLRIG